MDLIYVCIVYKVRHIKARHKWIKSGDPELLLKQKIFKASLHDEQYNVLNLALSKHTNFHFHSSMQNQVSKSAKYWKVALDSYNDCLMWMEKLSLIFDIL